MSSDMTKRRALVVDDAAVMRRLLSLVLSAHPGLEVVGTAGTGADALRLTAELRPDLITLDLEMPGMDGLQVLHQLRASHPALPIFIVATPTDAGCQAAQRAVVAGATDYVAKPDEARDLPSALEYFRRTLLPRFDQPAQPPPALQILIVDDGMVNRRMLGSLVDHFQGICTEAADGLAAVEAVAASKFDLIFMDCEMPRLNGYEATRRIRAEHPAGADQLIVGIPGTVQSCVRQACLAAGMDDLMFKPFHRNFVRAMLTRCRREPQPQAVSLRGNE